MERQPFEEGWKVPPGGGSDDTSQDQSTVTNTDCTVDGVAAGKSKTSPSRMGRLVCRMTSCPR